MTINEQFKEYGVVPVVVLNDAKDALPLAKALVEGGLACAEVTFRTDAAEESIRLMSEAYPEMLVGAGTVLTIDQVNRAVKAGAKFIVSPGFDPEIVDYCLENNIPVLPGCITPSEVAQAVKRGLKVVKFFPAGSSFFACTVACSFSSAFLRFSMASAPSPRMESSTLFSKASSGFSDRSIPTTPNTPPPVRSAR